MHFGRRIRAFTDRKHTTCREKTNLLTTPNIRFAEGKHTTCRGKSDALPTEKEQPGLKREYWRSISTVNILIYNWLPALYRKLLARMGTNHPPAGKKRFSANIKCKVSKRQSRMATEKNEGETQKKGKRRKFLKKKSSLCNLVGRRFRLTDKENPETNKNERI